MAKATNAKTNDLFPADFIEKARKALLEEKQKLEKELSKFAKRNPHTVEEDFDSKFPDYGDKEDENAAEVADYVVNLSLENNLEKSLRDVNQSLERLKNGAYGICKYCHGSIEKKRLIARPTSSSCMGCKKAITQEI